MLIQLTFLSYEKINNNPFRFNFIQQM